MSGPRIGELFAGYGGLGTGVRAVLGGEIAWFSEFDAAPSKILAHHWPGVPNFGDITLIDWSTVPPVDILTGGFPCQDVSLAGARKGLKDGTRSGLWSYFAEAIDALRPGLVAIENVRGLLSAKTLEEIDEGTGDLEFDPASLGELGRGDRPVLNAFGRVLGDLAELGYDTEWVGLRAADAGAPHGRFRVFVLAYPRGGGLDRWANLVRDGRDSRVGGEAVYHSGDSDSPLIAPNSDSGERDWWERCTVGCPVKRVAAARGSDVLAPDAGRERLGKHSGESSAGEAGSGSRDFADGPGGLRADTDWGPYRPAIERWEGVTGRIAPSPTNPDGKNGNHRLSAGFVEWMMGLPAGHVTGESEAMWRDRLAARRVGHAMPVGMRGSVAKRGPFLTRNEQLKALGNGVVPQQATLAIRHMLGRMT